MKKFCFNFTIDGVLTIAPLYICVLHFSKDKAAALARKYLAKKNDKKVHVFKDHVECSEIICSEFITFTQTIK